MFCVDKKSFMDDLVMAQCLFQILFGFSYKMDFEKSVFHYTFFSGKYLLMTNKM